MAALPWFDFSLGQNFTVGRGGNHDGRDVQTPLHTPLTNLVGGTVTPHTGWYPWGGEVDILTASGITETWAHLDAIAVKPGQVVQAGQLIGLSGGEGLPRQYSTGPHTHFSLFSGAPWNNAGAIDPTGLLQWAQATGGGPSVPDPITGGMAGTSGLPGQQTVAQAGQSIINVTVDSTLGTIMKGLGFQDVNKFLWQSGLLLLGGLLLLAGIVVFILPGREKAMQAAGVAARVA